MLEVGDTLVLKEWDPETEDYTGRELRKKVTYVATTKDAENWGMFSKEDIDKHGFIIISFSPENDKAE